ncbi:MAG: CoA transferase [Nitriliruptorales bacterium]|nr:CoA transferase [Nitriliruptorales bacterium]
MPTLLEGVRVLEFGQYAAAPYAGMVLAELGADVIKIEPPGGDAIRHWAPRIETTHGAESGAFFTFNHGKRSVELDLATAGGQQAARRLIETADMLVENNRPGVMKRFGLDYGSVREINPRLAYASISGYGQDGPRRDDSGFDLTLQARVGLMTTSGPATAGAAEPLKIGVPLVDIGAGAYAVFGLLAVYSAVVRGGGDFVDVPMQATSLVQMSLLANRYWLTGELPEPMGTAHPLAAPYQAFRTRDGHLAVAAGNESLWRRVVRVVGLPELSGDPRFATLALRAHHQAELAAVLERRLVTESTRVWEDRFTAAGIPCSAVQDLSQALADPQVLHRGLVEEVEHPRLRTLKRLGFPLGFGELAPQRLARPPDCGEHTAELLREVGMAEESSADPPAPGSTPTPTPTSATSDRGWTRHREQEP